MQVNGWGGLVAVVGLIRTAAEILPITAQEKKAVVVFLSGAASYLFSWNVPALLGLQVAAGVWTPIAAFVVNTALLALATFTGHDALDKLAGKS